MLTCIDTTTIRMSTRETKCGEEYAA